MKKRKNTWCDGIRRVVRLTGWSVVVCILLIVLWAFKSGWVQNKINQTVNRIETIISDIGFKVVQINIIDGRKRTSIDDIHQALELEQGDLMTFDIEAAHERLKKLPWIKKVSIKKRLPNFVDLYVEEKKPIALWQDKRNHYPVDENGEIIQAQPTGLSELIVVVGPDAYRNAPDLIDILKDYPSLNVKSASWIGNRRWDLKIDDIETGIVISLPENDVKGALDRLIRYQQENHILEEDLSVIDLVLPDQLIISNAGKKPLKGKK